MINSASRAGRRGIVLSLILAACVAGCAARDMDWLVRDAYRADPRLGSFFGKLQKGLFTMSPEEEDELGQFAAAQILTEYRPLQNEKLNHYVSCVGETLAAHSSQPYVFRGWHFQVLDTDEMNAFATPGGYVFVTKGLLKRTRDEDALAAVLAHEIGHVALAHGRKALSEAYLVSAFTPETTGYILVQGDPALSRRLTAYVNNLDTIVDVLIHRGYGRGQEHDADEYAYDLLKKTGYDTGGLHRVLAELRALEGSHVDRGWFKTHPKPSDRLDNLDFDDPVPPAPPGPRRARFDQAAARL